MKMYLFYNVNNWAETWRDPDEFHYSNFKIFSTFEKMCNYVIPYANDYLNEKYHDKIEKIEFDKDGEWCCSNIVVKEVEADEDYLSQKAEREKEEAAYDKWCKELGLIQGKPQNQPYKSKYLKNV